jgi:hypothetical protein
VEVPGHLTCGVVWRLLDQTLLPVEQLDSAQYDATVFGSARRTGGRHGCVAYFPTRLPRQVPISPENLMLIADAEAALGRLAGAGRLLPDPTSWCSLICGGRR